MRYSFIAAFLGMAIAGNATAADIRFLSEGASGDSRVVTIHADGALTADASYGPFSSKTSISFDEKHITITETSDGIVNTSVIDVDLSLNPDQDRFVADYRGVLNTSKTHGSVRKVFLYGENIKAGNSCQGELDDLLSAADALLSACSPGGGGLIGSIACIDARANYVNARDRYRRCVGPEEDQAGPL